MMFNSTTPFNLKNPWNMCEFNADQFDAEKYMGVQITWTIPTTRRNFDEMSVALKAAGLNPAFLRPSTVKKAVARALKGQEKVSKEVPGGNKEIARKVLENGTRVVQSLVGEKVDREAEENKYATVTKVYIDKNSDSFEVEGDKREVIQNEILAHKDGVTDVEIRAAVTKAIIAVHGISPRPHAGGVYWVLAEHVKTVGAICKFLKDNNLGEAYVMEIPKSDRVAAITWNLAADEMTEELKAIEAAVEKMEKRAVPEAHQKALGQVEEMMGLYAKALNMGGMVEGIKEGLEKAKERLVTKVNEVYEGQAARKAAAK